MQRGSIVALGQLIEIIVYIGSVIPCIYIYMIYYIYLSIVSCCFYPVLSYIEFFDHEGLYYEKYLLLTHPNRSRD